MANKRNYEWALASAIDGFFTQDKLGGVTQRVPFTLIVSSLQKQSVFQPIDGDLTAISAISGTGVLTRTGANRWAVVSSVAPTDHASEHHYGGGDQLAGSSIAGLRVTDAPEFGGQSLNGYLWWKAGGKRVWSAVGNATALEIAARNADGSAIDWPLTIGHGAGEDINLGGSTSRPVNIKYSLKINGVDAITSAREGRLTGLRLTNLSTGQIPVCSDGNGQITSSGETDDGTYFSSNRLLRLWSTLTKSGNTWTDLQWTQSTEERVSILSSNAPGTNGCHSLALVPYDADTTGRTMGGIDWAQKVTGKTGSAPGLKAVLSAKTTGAGGSVGGFGGQFRFEYRPDNGANLVDALRIGAFGGSTPDAVETAILLRANAGIESLGMRWASNAGRVGLLPSTVNPALGVFGFSIDAVGEVEIEGTNSATISAEGSKVMTVTLGSVDVAGTLDVRTTTVDGNVAVSNDLQLYAQVGFSGSSGDGGVRLINGPGGSTLGVNAGYLEVFSSEGVGIGTPGGAGILVSPGDVGVANAYFSGFTKSQSTERTGSAPTAASDSIVIYIGTGNATESMPEATGSNRKINYSYAAQSGTWTLDAYGTDLIVDGSGPDVGSVAITVASNFKTRTYYDAKPGLWVRL